MIIRYLRDDNGIPWATIVAFSPDHVAASVCSPKDQFSKPHGRWLATLRVLAGAVAPRLFDFDREQVVVQAVAELSEKAKAIQAKHPEFFDISEGMITGVQKIGGSLSKRKRGYLFREVAATIAMDPQIGLRSTPEAVEAQSA